MLNAVTACSIFAEMMAWCKGRGSSIYEMLMDIYTEYGFYHDALRNVVRKGISGANEIKAIMEGYRNEPPQEIASLKVVEQYDYLVGKYTNNLTGESGVIDIESSNVLQYILEDGSMISVRPSGTEPKIKYYYGLKLPFDKGSNYFELRNEAESKIAAIESSLGLI